MQDGPGSLFGVRKAGEDGFYRREADFLYVMPEIVTKGAAFAADPASWICNWLQAQGVPSDKLRATVREHLDYLLAVLEACRTEDYSVAFDESRVDPHVYNAIMMGMSAVAFRKFNRLFREARFTDRHRGTREPIDHVDKEAALRMFDTILSNVS
jgi:hypothetical protein